MSYPAIFFIKKKFRFSTAARNYLNRLDSAGLRVTTYDRANARLIDRLVANGGNFWPASGAFCAMAGYLYPGNGANLVPLKDGHDAGTLNAFVTGDWNAVTGLKGDGSTKYVDSNRSGNADGASDITAFTHITEAHDASAAIGMFFGHDSRVEFWQEETRLRSRIQNSTGSTPAAIANYTGFAGFSRDNSSNYLALVDGAENTITEPFFTRSANNYYILARNDSGDSSHSNGRQSIYGFGPNLNGAGELAELDAAITEWQAALAAA